jgi:Kef-type K+ transport system membrane component KefB
LIDVDASSFFAIVLVAAIAAMAIGTLIPILRDNGELKTHFGTYLPAAGGASSGRSCW